MNHLTRRQALLSGLFGAGGIGLRAFASGIPISMLLNPRAALAAAATGAPRAQYGGPCQGPVFDLGHIGLW